VKYAVTYNYPVFEDHRSKLTVESEKSTVSEVTRGQFQEFDPVQGTMQPIQTLFLDAVEGGGSDRTFVEAGSFVKRTGGGNYEPISGS